MAEENIFADEWRDCLRAHYQHVIRTRDQVTEPSLRVVMHQAGFDDAELAELRVRATMHVDDAGVDFVPDMDVLDTPVEAAAAPPVFPVVVPSAVPEEADIEIPLVEEVTVMAEELFEEPELLDVPIPEDAEVTPEVTEDEEEPDSPAQLSLF